MKKELGYRTWKKNNIKNNSLLLAEVTNVLFYFFDRFFSLQDCESKGAVQPSDIYGSAHLLR
jgi:hypothetical protein